MGKDWEWSEAKEDDCVVVREEHIPKIDDPTGWARVPSMMRECYCDCPNVHGNFREYYYGSLLGWVSEWKHKIHAEMEKERSDKS